jgi:Tol biopolymer transport system component
VCKVEVAEEASSAEELPAEPAVAHTAEKKTEARKRLRTWALAGGATLAVVLAVALWYLRRPLPPPRITAYTQITHDGRAKYVGGTDGSRVYFTEFSPSQIALVGVNGGEIALLPLEIPAVELHLMDISPDGSNALVGGFELNHSVPVQWVVPVLGGAAKRLEDGGGETFTPDGGSVVYSNLSGEIFKVHIDGSDKRKLTSVGSGARGLRWSPDGKVARFSKDDGLWEMTTDGAAVHRLLPNWNGRFPPCCGKWTHDGNFYLFLADGELWALDERRSLFRQPSAVPIQLTSGPLQWGTPIPARDGKTIFADGFAPRGELSRIDLKTGAIQPYLGGISAEFVSFSPDGKSVAYVTFPEGILWRANRDGSNRVQLTQPPNHVVNPRWSPDSKEIVFITETPAGRDSIRRVSAVDGAPLWLMSEEPAEMHDANWSPDGKKILFARSAGHGFATGKRDLRIVDLETRQVTVVPGSDEMWSPRWSPDGRYVVAFRGVTGDLPLFDFATQKWRNLSSDGDAEYPSFSRDSRFIYFLRLGRDQGVFRIAVASGGVERVVNMTDWHLTGGYSMSLDPTDAPLVLRDTGSDDIYALTLEEK